MILSKAKYDNAYCPGDVRFRRVEKLSKISAREFLNYDVLSGLSSLAVRFGRVEAMDAVLANSEASVLSDDNRKTIARQ